MADFVSHSYSRLNDWRSCHYKFREKYITKSVKFEQSPAMAEGERVHKALELRVRSGVPLGPTDQRYEPIAAKVASIPGDKYCEFSLTVDRDLRPCGAKDWNNAWVRAKADVLILNKDATRAMGFDWKTGKIKDDEDQLKLSAALTFEHFPTLETVSETYAWIDHGQHTTSQVYHRSGLKALWEPFLREFEEIQNAATIGHFKAQPSKFACGYCDVNKKKLCPYTTHPYIGK